MQGAVLAISSDESYLPSESSQGASAVPRRALRTRQESVYLRLDDLENGALCAPLCRAGPDHVEYRRRSRENERLRVKETCGAALGGELRISATARTPHKTTRNKFKAAQQAKLKTHTDQLALRIRLSTCTLRTLGNQGQ